MNNTICNNYNCPFADCEHHIKTVSGSGYYVFADLCGECRRYIAWLVDEVKKEEAE